jgi:hypothetical protein
MVSLMLAADVSVNGKWRCLWRQIKLEAMVMYGHGSPLRGAAVPLSDGGSCACRQGRFWRHAGRGPEEVSSKFFTTRVRAGDEMCLGSGARGAACAALGSASWIWDKTMLDLGRNHSTC